MFKPKLRQNLAVLSQGRDLALSVLDPENLRHLFDAQKNNLPRLMAWVEHTCLLAGEPPGAIWVGELLGTVSRGFTG